MVRIQDQSEERIDLAVHLGAPQEIGHLGFGELAPEAFINGRRFFGQQVLAAKALAPGIDADENTLVMLPEGGGILLQGAVMESAGDFHVP
jgi:hypothetical protein